MNRFGVVFLCCLSSQVFAQEIDERCQLPAALCELHIRFESADAELNDVYKEIMGRIASGVLSDRVLVDASELKQSLIISQRSWLAFRDKNCDAFYVLQSGGRQRNESRLECQIEMTKERIAYLQNWY